MYVEGEGVPVGLARLIASLRPIGPLDKYPQCQPAKESGCDRHECCATLPLCKPFRIDRRIVLHRTVEATTPAKTGLIPSIACLWRIS